jgi:hypothetical protein
VRRLGELLPTLHVLHIRDEAMENIPAFLVPLPRFVHLLNLSGCKRLRSLPLDRYFGGIDLRINKAGCSSLLPTQSFGSVAERCLMLP